MPYDASRDGVYSREDDDSYCWDAYSVGVILVEVFYGTDVAAALSSVRAVQ